ncbi:MAG: hypothetical protein HY828_10660 [Actinobacteria bacterium]|nr:hypothetical protein [Actinomycetota bacterium]
MYVHPYAIEMATDHQRALASSFRRHRLVAAARSGLRHTRTTHTHHHRTEGND